MKNLLIYVAGIPNKTSVSELEDCFYFLGFSVKVEANKNQSQRVRRTDTLTEGYCVISVKCTSAYDEILTSKEIILKKRRLMCKPYLTGAGLYKQNAINNRKRVILKYVPSYISPRELKHFIETSYGKIEQFFAFKSESESSQIGLGRKFTSYSIMFLESDVALQFSANSNFELIDGVYIQVERFTQRKREERRLANSTEQPEFLEKPASHQRANMEEQAMDQYVKTTKEQKETYNNGEQLAIKTSQLQLPISKGRARSQDQECKDRLVRKKLTFRRTGSLERMAMAASGYQRLEFIQELCTALSCINPTSKVYRLLRSDDFEYLATFELNNTWIANTNFLYTQKRKRRCYTQAMKEERPPQMEKSLHSSEARLQEPISEKNHYY